VLLAKGAGGGRERPAFRFLGSGTTRRMDVAEAVPDDGQVATATAKPLFSLSLSL
jgi:hypothetical protein